MTDFTSTRIHCRAGILILAALLLSSCGELAYKRGAGPGDLDAARQACKAHASNAAALETCMSERGWAIQNLGRMEPLDADPVVKASVIPSDRRIENQASAPPDKPGSAAPVATAQRTVSPLDPFKVNSWWKTGSGAASLATDTEACVARLGEAHRPDSLAQTATRGLLLCMKEKGWSGLRAK